MTMHEAKRTVVGTDIHCDRCDNVDQFGRTITACRACGRDVCETCRSLEEIVIGHHIFSKFCKECWDAGSTYRDQMDDARQLRKDERHEADVRCTQKIDDLGKNWFKQCAETRRTPPNPKILRGENSSSSTTGRNAMFSKKQTCELVMIIDRSGSMSACKQEVIEGMNEFIAKQKELPGRCFLTSVIFDHEYEVRYESKDIQKLGYMGDDTYVPRGSTALYDAIGRTIESCRVRFAKTNPDRVICVIVTDGMENASKEFTQEQVRKLVSGMDDWRFVFIGANQDAVLTAQEVAMPTAGAMNVASGPLGTRQAMLYANNASSALRGASDTVYASNSLDYAGLQDDARSAIQPGENSSSSET